MASRGTTYAEANRTLWRQTVLPLVQRTAKALSAWLALAFAGGNAGPAPDTGGLELRPDLDALWQRVRKSDFLTINEKRAAVGYGAVEGGDRLSGVAPEG
ncbi:phage portal protein [Methyloceanibacter sp.]|uniref:phage portal protein n=1 Tax=Methyloceanibacter sp. TaxID=1965321 RepID=UPI002CD7E4DF|nr:phage portal protein [Methyloceanibacter sp.]